MKNRQGKGERGIHPEDLTRNRQYRGVDPSGYERGPQGNDSFSARGEWRETAPGNYGEAGGRWHDHEMPYRSGRRLVGLGEADQRGDAPTQAHGGFQRDPRDLWPGAPGGSFAYGSGGREGYAPSAGGRTGGAPGGGPSGPQGEHSGKGPRGYKRADERIHEDVCEHLTAHPHVDATDVTVTVRDGEVVLEGMVESRSAKRLAEDVASSVRGVVDVMNQLRIRRSVVPPQAEASSASTEKASTGAQWQRSLCAAAPEWHRSTERNDPRRALTHFGLRFSG